jgi:hypothetical protein
MRAILILFVVAAAVFFFYPIVNEGARTPCGALEKRALTLATRGGGAESIVVASLAREILKAGKGRIAAEFARRRNPDVPVSVSCSYNYWHSLLDRGWLTDVMRLELR